MHGCTYPAPAQWSTGEKGCMGVIKTMRSNYRWIIAAVCFCSCFLALGLMNGTSSLYIIPVTSAFGVTRSAFSVTISLRFLMQAILNLGFGFFVTRLGARAMMSMGMLAVGSAFVCFSKADSLLLFYIGGALLGWGLGWTSTTICASLINTWFQRRKGTVTGFVMAGNGIGGALSSIIIGEWLSRYGWRVSYMNTAWIAFLFVLPVFLLVRDKPWDQGAAAHMPPETDDRKSPAHFEGLTLRQVCRRPYFYISLLCTFLIGFMINSLYQATVPHVQDLGLGADFSAVILSIFMVTIAFSKFFVGFLHDRIGFRKTYMLCLACAMVAAILFITMKSRVVAVACAVIQGFCLPLETVLIPLIVLKLFGNKDFASIFGLFTAFSSAGIAAGNPLFSLAHDLWGSYTHAALLYAVLLGIIIVSMAFVFRAAEKEHADDAAKYGKVLA